MSFLRFLLSLAALAAASPLPDAQNASFVHWESPHVHPLDGTPDGNLLLAVNTPDNRLEVFDVSTGTPVYERSIPVGLDPVTVRVRSNTEAWVVNHVSDSVSIVDLLSGHVKATLQTADEPCDVVFAGAPLRAFVSCSQPNQLLVFDLADLSAAPIVMPLLGIEPRALATSADGTVVYCAFFESGNGTTAVSGATMTGAFPPDAVSQPSSPYGGTNPAPNAGAGFDPPLDPGLPAPPRASIIVRRDDGGSWMDDNGGDWTNLVSGPEAPLSGRPEGWTLIDHDAVAVVADTLDTFYVGDLMNINMALGVHPVTGNVNLVGTDATNEVRFEPNLTGTFVRTLYADINPKNIKAAVTVDLNAHLDYQTATLPQDERDKGLADPRAIAWIADGTRGFIAGMGTNNLVIVEPPGTRTGIKPTIEVGEGPTGLFLAEQHDRLYVLNKFGASISVVFVPSEKEIARVSFHDPTPEAIRVGRRHLYSAHDTSGTGVVACASCHVDARLDQLAWDLGSPGGEMTLLAGQNLGANLPGLSNGAFADHHPMKGPMLTQTLQDIVGHEPLHWRGDKNGLEDFNGAFIGLQGDDQMLSAAEMQEFEDFLATIHYPPNPYRLFDNGLTDDQPLPGFFSTGAFSPAGTPLPNGDAQRGRELFKPPSLLTGSIACSTCHTTPTGAGTDYELVNGVLEPFPVGPAGEHHAALTSSDPLVHGAIKIPQLRNLYERVGATFVFPFSLVGFGFNNDGTVDSIERFLSQGAFSFQNDQQLADVLAYLLAFSGELKPDGSIFTPLDPPGSPANNTHAAVGRQVTVSGAADPGIAVLEAMLALADEGAVGVVAKGSMDTERGWLYLRSAGGAPGAGRFQSDRRSERVTKAELLAQASVGHELTFTVVPAGSGVRIGIDRDMDGVFDRDEVDQGHDPADPADRPRAVQVRADERLK